MYKLVLTEFPFTEASKKKKRPGLLLSEAYGKYKIMLIAYITSQRGEGLESEVRVGKTDENGLGKNSVIKLHKLTNLPQSAIKGELGVLSAEKSIEVQNKLKKLLQL